MKHAAAWEDCLGPCLASTSSSSLDDHIYTIFRVYIYTLNMCIDWLLFWLGSREIILHGGVLTRFFGKFMLICW